MNSWFCVSGPPCHTTRVPSMMFSTTFDRSGSTEHSTPMSGFVNENGSLCDRATLLNVPYPTFFIQPAILHADHANPRGHQQLITSQIHFVAEPVVNNNVLNRYARRLHSANDFPHQFRRRAARRCSGRVDLQAHDVVRRNELRPPRGC